MRGFSWLILLCLSIPLLAGAADAGSLHQEGWALYRQGRHQAALEKFQAAIEQDRNNGWHYFGAGLVLRAGLSDPDKALQYQTQALRLLPAEPDVCLEYALCLDARKRYIEALVYFTNSLTLFERKGQPPYTWISLTLAAYHLFHLSQKDYPRAIRICQEMRTDSRFSMQEKDTALDWQAYAWYQLGDFDHYVPLAQLYLEKGENQDARRAHQERLACWYYQQGMLEDAWKIARERGPEWWLTRRLAPHTVTLTGDFRLKKITQTRYQHLTPGRYYIPLPVNAYGQQFISLVSRPAPLRIIREGRYVMAEYDFSAGFPEHLLMTIQVRIQENNQMPRSTGPLPATEMPYFRKYQDSYFDLDSPVLQQVVKQVTLNITEPLAQARALQGWVSSNIIHIMKYPAYCRVLEDGSTVFATEKIPDYPNLTAIVQAKKGHCHHISDVYYGLCTLAGIPVRVIDGLIIDPDPAKNKGVCQEHYTVEIYDTEQKQWFYVEPQDTFFFGISQFWHIITGYEMLKVKYPNCIPLTGLRWEEAYYLGNPAALTYTY